MDASNLAALITSALALFGVWVTSRNARKAAERNVVVTTSGEVEKARLAAETAAYERARKMDVETIERRDKEIKEIREQYEQVRSDNLHLNEDVKRVDRENREVLEKSDQVMEQNRELIAQNRELADEVRRLRTEVRRLTERQTRYDRGLSPNDETPIRVRATDVATDPMMPRIEDEDYGE
jgi:chromosome segregation ATPase